MFLFNDATVVQNQLDELNEKYVQLLEHIEKLHSSLKEGELLSDALYETSRVQLEAFYNDQKSLLQDLQQLPDFKLETKNFHDLCQELSEYICLQNQNETLGYVLSCSSQNEKVQNALIELQKQYQKAMDRHLTSDEIERLSALAKLIQEAIEETDSFERYIKADQLKAQLDPILCFGLSNGLIEYNIETKNRKDDKKTENCSAAKMQADTEEPVQTQQSEAFECKENSDIDSESIEESVSEPEENPVLEEKASQESEPVQKEEMDSTELDLEERLKAARAKKLKMKSIEEMVRAGAKGIVDKEIEEEFIVRCTKELKQYFEPDEKEGLQPKAVDLKYEQDCFEKAEAAGLFEEFEEVENERSGNDWEIAGILHTSRVIDGYSGGKVSQRRPASLTEKMKRNDFARKLSQEEGYFNDAVMVLDYFTRIHSYYIPQTCYNYISETPYAMEMKMETAFHNSMHSYYEQGLINKFSMAGCYDVYCPSKMLSDFLVDKKIKRFFMSDDMFKGLVSKKLPYYETLSPAQMMFFQADSICSKDAYMLMAYVKEFVYFSDRGSSMHIVSIKNMKQVVFTTIFTRTGKDFLNYLHFYYHHAPFTGIFICVQSELKKARAIAEWLCTEFDSHLTFYAMDYKENIAYRLDGKDIIDFNDEESEFVKSYQQAAKDENLRQSPVPIDDTKSIALFNNKISEAANAYPKKVANNKETAPLSKVSDFSQSAEKSASSDGKKEETLLEHDLDEDASLKEKQDVDVFLKQEETQTEESSASINEESPQLENALEDQPVHKMERIYSLMSDKQFYAASTYLKILQNHPQNDEDTYLYDQFAYALNDPYKHPIYDAQNIIEAFSNLEQPISSYFYLAAALRTFFYDEIGFDYSLSYLADSLKSIPLLKDYPSLETLLFMLLNFKKEHDYQGVDAYASYRMQERNDIEESIKQVVAQCKEYYQQLIIDDMIKDKHNNRCYTECRHLIFSKESPLGLHLEIAANHETELAGDVEDYLIKNFIMEKMPIAPENVSPILVNKLLDESWHDAKPLLKGTANADKLIGTARKILEKYVTLCVKALCTWCVLVKNPLVSQNNAALEDFRRMEEELKNQISASLSSLDVSNVQNPIQRAGLSVLTVTLQELRERMTGSWSILNTRYYYVPFLKQKYILLDENYLPVYEEIEEMPSFDIEDRLLAHLEAEKSADSFSWKERLRKINEGMEDNFGINDLIIDYLAIKGTPAQREILSSYIYASKENRIKAKAMHEARYQDFKSYLELAKAYGQMDDMYGDQKEKLELCVEHLYEQANASQNYGYFGMLLEKMKAQIQSSFSKRKEQLQQAVANYQEQEEKASASGQIDAKKQSMILSVYESLKAGNYTAAEDLFNRLSHNDLDDSFQALSSDLEDFLEDYERLYLQTSVLSRDLKQLVSIPAKNKEGRGGQKLIDNWPKNSQEAPDKIKNMLIGLGFPASMVVNKDKSTLAPDASYTIMLPKSSGHGRKISYSHPVAAFGSEMEEQSIRVLCFFGRLDADAIISKCKQRSELKNTIIFANTTLNKADRRRFARKSKSELSEKIFLLVDRVAISWLAQNYSAETIARKLMSITLPFSYGQLYVEKSTEPIPPEMFIGRKSELEKIRDPKGVNLVHGGRQLGKSALLAMAKHQVDKNENNDRALVVDIKGLNCAQSCQKVATALIDARILDKHCKSEDWSELCYFIRNRLDSAQSPAIPYLLLMMDEADAFIESSKEQAYKPIDALKELENTCSLHFKFVLAGLHNVVRFDREAALSSNSSLAHLGSLSVRPFKYSEARSLLEIPLHYVGFRFSKDEKTEQLISMILGHTNYFPSLIQFYCAKLIESLQENYASYAESDTPPYRISEKQIQEVLRQESLNEEIKKKFFITLRLDEDNYYYILALMIALRYHTYEQASSSAIQIYDLAKELECTKILDLNPAQIQALLEEMRELNILQTDGNQSYRFSRNSFLTNMGEPHEIEDALMAFVA